MRTLQITCLTIVIIGALNWGLVGLFNFDLVSTIFGGQTNLAAKIVYMLVGISGLVCIKTLADLFDEIN